MHRLNNEGIQNTKRIEGKDNNENAKPSFASRVGRYYMFKLGKTARVNHFVLMPRRESLFYGNM